MLDHLRILIVLLLGTALWASPLSAQSPDSPFGYLAEILIDNGKLLRGQVLYADSTIVRFKPERRSNEVSLPRDRITEIREIGPWRPLSSSVLNALTPVNGYGLRPGEVYHQNILLGINFLNVGITPYFTLGAGVELISSISRDPEGAVYALSPKFTFPLQEENLRIGAGAFLLNLPEYEGGLFTHQFYYSGLTFGPRHRNFSAGLCLMSIEGRLDPAPIFLFAGNLRANDTFGFQAELIGGKPSDGVVGTFGFQLHGRVFDFRFSWPLQLISAFERGIGSGLEFAPIPVVGFGLSFAGR